MSGVSDISLRALVMCGSSAEAQELTHSARYTAEITLDSISWTCSSFLCVPKLTSSETSVILILLTAAGTDFSLVCQSLFGFCLYLSRFSLQFSVRFRSILPLNVNSAHRSSFLLSLFLITVSAVINSC